MIFLSDKRLVSRLLYFHFMVALLRIKDLQRRSREDVWARYYEKLRGQLRGLSLEDFARAYRRTTRWTELATEKRGMASFQHLRIFDGRQ